MRTMTRTSRRRHDGGAGHRMPNLAVRITPELVALAKVRLAELRDEIHEQNKPSRRPSNGYCKQLLRRSTELITRRTDSFQNVVLPRSNHSPIAAGKQLWTDKEWGAFNPVVAITSTRWTVPSLFELHAQEHR